ncbi:putative ABC transporter ATP-binding protein YxlF [Myxococcaceae bacterium]|jgi:ABC-2 type transport system ATP-binding protein|nr:putative ABC transporter ATP-binding protein YxlF [Myxococcaceae bacterium]
MIALELAGVSKRYGTRRALDRVDLAFPTGAAVGLLGPNGAGKTTVLRLLLGFARPTLGSVRLRGRNPFDPASREGLGYLPERLRLPARTTLRAFLELHGGLAGLSGAELARGVDAILDRTALRDREGEQLGSLSKGLAQRAGFAQALLGDPELLLLDEPTSGLDPLGVRDARDWIHAARGPRHTLVVCSHVLTEVERVCDHVVILSGGRVAASGPVESVVAGGESLEDAFVRIVRGAA